MDKSPQNAHFLELVRTFQLQIQRPCVFISQVLYQSSTRPRSQRRRQAQGLPLTRELCAMQITFYALFKHQQTAFPLHSSATPLFFRESPQQRLLQQV